MFVHHSTSKQRGKATGCRWDCFCLSSGKRGEIVIVSLGLFTSSSICNDG